MARPELGTKRICEASGCDTKFYDLGNMPYTCPTCQFVHEEKSAAQPEEVETKATPNEEAETEDDELEVDAPEGVDVISLDEAATDEDEDLAAINDEELPDVPDDDTSDSEESDVFLEEDEDDPNVSDLIGGVGAGSDDE